MHNIISVQHLLLLLLSYFFIEVWDKQDIGAEMK